MHVYDHTETSISLHNLAHNSGVITGNSCNVLLSVLEHTLDLLHTLVISFILLYSIF